MKPPELRIFDDGVITFGVSSGDSLKDKECLLLQQL